MRKLMTNSASIEAVVLRDLQKAVQEDEDLLEGRNIGE